MLTLIRRFLALWRHVLTRDMSWKPMQKRSADKSRYKLWIIIAALILVNLAVVLYHGDPRPKSDPTPPQPGPAKAEAAAPIAPGANLPVVLDTVEVTSRSPDTGNRIPDPHTGLRSAGAVQNIQSLVLRAGQTPAAALSGAGIASDDINGAFASLAEWVDFRRMRPGDVLQVRTDAAGALVGLEVSQGRLEQARTRRGETGWQGEKLEVSLDTVVAEVQGEVRSSLWDALVTAGESPALVQALVDIFAYEIDFYTEMRPGDTFRLLVEKRYANGEFLDYGAVTAAEFTTGTTPHRAFAFVHDDGHVSYFDASGESLRKQLLKAPLRYGAVTSRFGVRRHPILGYTRNHNGTDYGVPVGTPVWSVGDGRVIKAGWHGGFGRLVEVSHANGWVSQYAHLSRINVRVGQRLRQKQIVGLVGQTGLATGPHLHYGLKKNGHYVNSLAQKFERSAPLVGPQLRTFSEHVAKRMDDLNKMRLAQQPPGTLPQKG